MISIEKLLDAVIPGDLKIGLPSASIVYKKNKIANLNLISKNSLLIEAVENELKEKYGIKSEVMESEQICYVLNIIKNKNIRPFYQFMIQVYQMYYSDRDVLGLIGVGSIPPYPDGNPVLDNDWSILEPVYSRGVIYKKCF